MTASEWVALVQAVAWPVSVLVVVVTLRRPIGVLLGSLGGRITRVSVASVSIELAVATEVEPPWKGYGGDDVRGLVPAGLVNDSYFDTLRQALWKPGSADCLVIDLKSADRQEWLTSRLHVFTWILARVKGVRAVVFLATRGGVNRSFVGVATTDAVLASLERAHPWLRRARWRAEATLMVKPLPADPDALERWRQPATAPDPAPNPPQYPDLAPTGPFDADEWWQAAREDPGSHNPLQAAQTFLADVQWTQPAGVPAPGPEWLRLPPRAGVPDPGLPTWEHAQWISLRDLADGALRDVIDADARSSPTTGRGQRRPGATLWPVPAGTSWPC